MKQRNTIKRRAIQEHPEEIEKDASLFVFTIELMLIRDKLRSYKQLLSIRRDRKLQIQLKRQEMNGPE